jgi:hypothetical protein
MARFYSDNPYHNYDGATVDFVNGAAAVPLSDEVMIDWLTANGYTAVQGSDTLSPWDELTFDQLVRFAAYCGVDATDKTKQELVSAIETALITIAKYEITAFDELEDVDAGTVAAPTYADAAAVQAVLPARVKATLENGMVADVPVTAWADTDTYDNTTAGSYTFTATLGAIPAPYANAAAVTATVEVVVGE